MNRTSVAQQAKVENSLSPTRGVLQRKCACGNHTPAGKACSECNKGGGTNLRSAVGNFSTNSASLIAPGTQHSDSDVVSIDKSKEKRDLPPVTSQMFTSAPAAIRSGAAEPGLGGSSIRREQPIAVFEGGSNELISESRRVVPSEGSITGIPMAQPPVAAGAGQTVIRGDFPRVTPREYWFFDGETPANYTVSTVLSTNRSGGTFNWRVSPHLTLSSATDATPTVTSAAPSAANSDAFISVRHTNTSGTTTAASYRVTVLAPKSLTHLRNVDSPHPTWVYESRIHYRIVDQFGTVLPRNVPINEEWTSGLVADFPGMNWRRGPEGAATVSPADWNDWIGGENVAFAAVPAPVTSAHADAGVAVYHWDGDWRVGSLTIGSGRRVISVTWQKNRGFARHT